MAGRSRLAQAMSAAPTSNARGNGRAAATAAPRRRRRDRAAAQPRGRAVGARGDPALRSLAVRAGDRGGAAPRGLLPRAARADLRGDARALQRERAGRRAHGHRPPAPARQARGRRRPGGGRRAHRASCRPRATPAATRRSCARTRCCGGCWRSTYEIQSSVLGHEAPPRELVEQAEKAMLEVARDDRKQDFRAIEDVLHEELDKLHRLSLEGTCADRHPLGLQGPRRDHGGLPAGQPDHHRRPPGDGQERAGVQHRRERRGRAQAAGGAVLAGDGRGRARPALRRLAGADQGRGAAQGPRRGAALAEDPLRQPAARGGAAVGRRLQRRRHARDPRQGAAPAQPMRGGPGADHHRLPAADAHRQPLRQPRDRRRRAQPRAEDPRARARRAGDRALPAQPRRRDAAGQETPALGPARERATSSRTPTS